MDLSTLPTLLTHLAPATLAVEFFDAGVFTTAALVSLVSLTLLEIVLGIDNVVFIAILSNKLPKEQQKKARLVGLGLAALMRIGFLFAISFVLLLDKPKYTVFTLPDLGLFDERATLANPAAPAETAAPVDPQGAPGPLNDGDVVGEAEAHSEEEGAEHDPRVMTIKDLIILLGGLFLLGKAVYEIHDKLEGDDHAAAAAGGPKKAVSFSSVIVQILLLDLVFSIDSVITAVGIAKYLSVMIVAVLIAVVVMIAFAGAISRFVERHPTMKMLALSFLVLIGVLLVAEAFEQSIPKGYVYFSMAFALGVEILNIRIRKVGKPVTLHQSYVDSDSPDGYGDVANAPRRGAAVATPPAT